ncbi:hypothetical protein ACH4YO_07945 [Streptomyces noursei]|uniref:hypothetical protein n=1 Tax=Streptomyces noursei TaxID=1971 RepID=UPI0033C936C7
MKVAILFDGGGFRVHDRDCRDVRYEAVKFRDIPWIIDVKDRNEADHAMWADIASGRKERGTPAHDKLVQEFADMGTTYLPCVKLMER